MTGLIVFRADWCPNCRVMERAGAIDALKKAKPDLAVTVEDLSQGETELSQSMRVRTIPSFILMDEDGEVLKRTTGAKTASELERWVKVKG